MSSQSCPAQPEHLLDLDYPLISGVGPIWTETSHSPWYVPQPRSHMEHWAHLRVEGDKVDQCWSKSNRDSTLRTGDPSINNYETWRNNRLTSVTEKLRLFSTPGESSKYRYRIRRSADIKMNVIKCLACQEESDVELNIEALFHRRWIDS